MLLPITMALAILLQPAPRDPALAPGVWRANDQVAPLDGRRTVTQTLYSSSDIPQRFGGPTVGILVLRCAAGSREAMVAWPGAFFSSRGAWVWWRVDGSEIREESWSNIQGMTSGVRSNDPNRLLDAIETGDQLVIRVQDHSTSQDIVFDLGDGATAVHAIREACP